MASSTNQIKVYDLKSFVKKYAFSPRDDVSRIVSVCIIPHDERLFVVLQSNIICILTKSLKLVRHFEPLKARQKYMQKSNHKMERLSYTHDQASVAADDNVADVDKLIKSVTRDHQNGTIVDVSFTQNGNNFCVSLCDKTMLLCSTSMWDVNRIIIFPDFFIKQLTFVPSSLQYNSNHLLTSTSNDELLLIDLKDLNSRMLIDVNQSLNFALSGNGRILLNVKKTGEIFVYNFDHFTTSAGNDIDLKNYKQVMTTVESNAKCSKQMGEKWNVELDKIQMKVIL